jgi:NADH-quinone oxidoreductase subunit L
LFSRLVDNTLPVVVTKGAENKELLFQILSSVIALSGIYLAYIVYFKKPSLSQPYSHSGINKFFEKGWGFDSLYETLFVRPIVWLSIVDKDDFFDLWSKGLARLALFFNRVLSAAQNGKLRWYLLSFVIGIVIILTYMLSK